MAEAVVNAPSPIYRQISMMVCGRAGIGKSTLLNILLGTKGKFVVNGPGGTKGLSSVSEMIHGIEVTMYDTPGLQSDPSDEDFIALMASVMNSVDLVLFCIDSVTTRWTAEAETVKKLHAAFGNEFWMNAIFVLTRSNMSQRYLADEDDDDLQPNEKIAKCEKAAKDIFEAFKEELLKQKVSADVVNAIPLVAAGSHKHRKLHFVAPKVYDEDFLPELWSLAVKRCEEQKRPLIHRVSNYKEHHFRLQDNFATLSPDKHALSTQLEELLNATSSPVSEETDEKTRPEPIVLNERQLSNSIVNAPRQISMMVCGKAGIGKSTLLNILLGTKGKFVVNGPGGVGNDCTEAGTKGLSSVSEMIHGIEVTMYDTPGLQSDRSDKDTIALIASVKESIDLVLFCVDSTTTSWTAEAETVRKLHAAFGNEFWMNAIFVLTRSNMSQRYLADEDDDDLQPNDKIAKCEKAAKDIFEAFKEELLKQKASTGIVKTIPLVAAGRHKQRKLHFVAPKVYDEDFLPELWSLAVKRCKVQKRLLFFAISNYKQQRFVLPDNATLTPEEQALRTQLEELSNATPSPLSEETNVETQPEPIVLNERQSKRVHKALATGLFGLIGAAAAGGGIGVGAAVWAATSLTMAAAGPIGIAAGAAVGLIGLSVLTGVLIYRHRKSKKLETVTNTVTDT